MDNQEKLAEETPDDTSDISIEEPKEDQEKEEEEEDFSSFADLTGFDVMTTDPGAAPAERVIAPPDKTDVMAPLRGMRDASEFRAPTEKKSHVGTIVKIAGGLAAAILLVAGIGLLTQDETRNNIQKQLEAANSAMNASSSAEASASAEEQTSTDTEAAESSSEAKSSLSISDAVAIVDEDTAFEYLTTIYDSLQSYNERVYSCIQTYNGTVFTPDRGQREAAAGIAHSLSAEMEADMKLLDSMNIGKASSLYNDYENVRRLLNDQYNRLGEITESWDISLKYDTPYQHENEILEPIRRNTGASGVSIYLEDFDANYWNSRPTR